MELGKHERQVTGKEALEEKQTKSASDIVNSVCPNLKVDLKLEMERRMTERNTDDERLVTSQESGTKPLTFTFVPSIGRLPTHFEVLDISKFLVTVPEEPKDLSNQGIPNKSSAVSHELAVNSGARQDCVSAVHTDSTRTIFQSPGCNVSKGEMQENDLFKAEFILITDSGDEDEVAAVSNNIHRPSNGYGRISAQLLATSHVSPGTGAGKPPGDGHVSGAASSLSTADQQKHQQYKIKTSYKAFAAIPTNTLLMEQKALEEPTKTASVTEGTALDTHSERRCESSPSFLQMSTESDVGKVSTTLQRAAGRETRYASLYKSAPMMTESQLTKPGVIRPVLVKAKSAQQKEEPYQPNPFKKYLEEISDQDTEQWWSNTTIDSTIIAISVEHSKLLNMPAYAYDFSSCLSKLPMKEVLFRYDAPIRIKR
ncbi:Mlip [Columba guinea]|nr:Mlip [Columba guinea]